MKLALFVIFTLALLRANTDRQIYYAVALLAAFVSA
jgi:hypothetical protein